MVSMLLRLGTRASALARWQADWVSQRLTALGHTVQLVPITTQGDVRQTETIGQLGSPGVFTKELQRALLEERIDLAVHSMKDLPTDEVPGLCLAAVPARESPRDVLISRQGTLEELPAVAVVGTGSLRRQAQLLHARGDLLVRSIRGNVDTRLEKLRKGQYDAIVLAEAGLVRLGLTRHVTQIFEPSVFMPAVGQGALAIEARAGDRSVLRAVAPLDDTEAHAAVLAERALLAALRGGCSAPIGAWARVEENGTLRLDAVVLDPQGRRRLEASDRGALQEPVELGRRAAARLQSAGASELIEQARG